MEKNIKLSASSIVFFVLNIIILMSSVIFRNFYIGTGYNLKIINITFFINIIMLLLCIAFNIYLLIYDNVTLKKVVALAVLIALIYGIINIFLIPYINKKNNAGYYEMTEKLTNYCSEYYCSKYETINIKNQKKFSLEKKYVDYNNETQLIKINIIYDKKSVNKIEATIYSSNESYSVFLIKEQLSLFLSNLNVELNEESINRAFESRDEEAVKFENQIYKVESIYKEGELKGFKTKIKISLQN